MAAVPAAVDRSLFAGFAARPGVESAADDMELILASSSKYRQQLLAQAGIACRIVPPDVDEAALTALALQRGQSPADLCRMLAMAKAKAVAAVHPDVFVLGSDQLLSFDVQILGKPGTAEAAIAQLQKLSGRTHFLLTAFAIIAPGRISCELVESQLTMRQLSPANIKRYVAADEPLDCAGSYKWESRGITLFERVVTSDPSAIIGLPLIGVVSELRQLGIDDQ